mmetsp:Transcript_1564/g.2162  ORF Transcript_1564/g.2162 Transcript_1564/m.2162 type:complete len:86 (-) Transcript_1564:132-389(-)
MSRNNKKCNSMAHPSKTQLLNKYNAKLPAYKQCLMIRRQSSIARNTKDVLDKIDNRELAHAQCMLSAIYPNYLEDFKVKRFKEKI